MRTSLLEVSLLPSEGVREEGLCDDDDFSDGSEPEAVPVVRATSRPGRAAAVKAKAKYTQDSDEEDDESMAEDDNESDEVRT